MKNNSLGIYKLPKIQLIMLWLNNYEFGESLINITEFVRFQSINELADRLIRFKEHNQDEFFRFSLNLNSNELNELRDYLLKRKAFIINHILKRGSFSPYTHLYQLYLQYLPDNLNEIEKSFLLDGYSNMLRELYGYDNIIQRRLSLEEKLNLR